jgi:hypothetical protein
MKLKKMDWDDVTRGEASEKRDREIILKTKGHNVA